MKVANSVLYSNKKRITGSENAKFLTFLRQSEKSVSCKLIRNKRKKGIKN